MELTDLYIKNFRCFNEATFSFTQPLVLIEGPNGTGKTSFLEALHYACYMRSFRTHSPTELVRFDQWSFFVKIGFITKNQRHELQLGFADKKRLVKLNQKPVSTYKQVLDHYRVVTLTEDDLELIKGSPDGRRRFIDHALMLHDSEYIHIVRQLKQVVDNRNSLLKIAFKKGSFDKISYDIWTEQLQDCTQKIQKKRKQELASLEYEVNQLMIQHVNQEVKINFTYVPKEYDTTLYVGEMRAGRSLFGAHLDDFTIQFQKQHSRIYASRGQQKLIMVLIKIAQVKSLIKEKGKALFLLDDFMTDFDPQKAVSLLQALQSLGCQLFFTSPSQTGFLENQLVHLGAQKLELTY